MQQSQHTNSMHSLLPRMTSKAIASMRCATLVWQQWAEAEGKQFGLQRRDHGTPRHATARHCTARRAASSLQRITKRKVGRWLPALHWPDCQKEKKTTKKKDSIEPVSPRGQHGGSIEYCMKHQQEDTRMYKPCEADWSRQECLLGFHVHRETEYFSNEKKHVLMVSLALLTLPNNVIFNFL